jgi:uncharacterized membrane protein
VNVERTNDLPSVGTPSKALTIIVVCAASWLLYVGLPLATSLVITTSGAYKAYPATYLLLALLVPAFLAVRSHGKGKELWKLTRSAALASVTVNLVVLPIVLGPALAM